MTVFPHPPYSSDLAPVTFLSFPDGRYCHFDTIEVKEVESQVVLNTLTEHDFQDAFKK
jgi:hypothetical protein